MLPRSKVRKHPFESKKAPARKQPLYFVPDHGDTAYIVVIASASRKEDPGFESRQGVIRFFGIYTLQCCCHCMYFRKQMIQFKEKLQFL
jgi:hypothetical protein